MKSDICIFISPENKTKQNILAIKKNQNWESSEKKVGWFRPTVSNFFLISVLGALLAFKGKPPTTTIPLSICHRGDHRTLTPQSHHTDNLSTSTKPKSSKVQKSVHSPGDEAVPNKHRGHPRGSKQKKRDSYWAQDGRRAVNCNHMAVAVVTTPF